MTKTYIKSYDVYLWNFIFSALFVVVLAGLLVFLDRVKGLPESISIFDVTLITLATFRITRLFVYDEVVDFLREAVLIPQKGEDMLTGEKIVMREEPVRGPRRTLAHLLGCPWCMGVWGALFLTFFHLYFAWAWIVLLVLSIAGVATFIQITANMIGWKAETLMQQARSNEN